LQFLLFVFFTKTVTNTLVTRIMPPIFNTMIFVAPDSLIRVKCILP